MTDRLVVALAGPVLGLFGKLPLRGAARLGRLLGSLAYHVDRRHRKVSLVNLAAVYGQEKSPGEIRVLARENFRRIGESLLCGLCTARMAPSEIDRVLEIVGLEKLLATGDDGMRPNRILALGHFGNFEIFAMAGHHLPGMQLATTYRAIDPPGLNDLLLARRRSRQCLFFERRRDAAKLRARLQAGAVVLGLLSDQHGGERGVKGPFLGIECSTSPAPAVLARRFSAPLHVAVCYRTEPARWRIEISDAIVPTLKGVERTAGDLTREVNRILENAVRRDPANWFWVHNRWRLAGPDSRSPM